jgi:CRISP-associated protein Cas1
VIEIDGPTWAARNSHWQLKPVPQDRRPAKRKKTEMPLILCGHGVSLRIDRGTLFIQNGFTHYPQEREEFRFFRGDLNRPSRIIMLDGSGSLSFDVVSWLAEQNVPLIRIDWRGDAVSVIGGSGVAFDSNRIRWQIETRADPVRRLEFSCGLIAEKIRNSITTLKTTLPDTPARANALWKAEAAIDRLQSGAVRSVAEVLLIEARAASAYFTAWRGLPLRWPSRAAYPIPDAWRVAGARSAVRASRYVTNRHATHPVNAMLNYAYAALRSQVQMEAVAEGYDPRWGIMHADREGVEALVFDLMEPRRPMVDAKVLNFVARNKVAAGDFLIREDGVCRLAPQLARRVCEAIGAV